MIVLLFILVVIFAEVLAPYPFAEVHPADRLQGGIHQVSAGDRPSGARLLKPPDLWGASFFNGRSGGDHPQCGGRCLDRRSLRIHWGEIRLGGAAFRRCMDVFSGTALAVDHHVHRGTGLLQIIVVLGGVGASSPQEWSAAR